RLALGDDRTIAIRFARCHEPCIGTEIVESIFTWVSTQDKEMQSLVVMPTIRNSGGATFQGMQINDATVEDHLNQTKHGKYKEAMAWSCRVAITVLLMANDPTVVRPDVLAN